jgi:hypothetical protein
MAKTFLSMIANKPNFMGKKRINQRFFLFQETRLIW